ncbi:hypothetical protein W97_05048 [Coniosporium apollinis CBS 100218]|uniref:N-acetyltransferase domain-containing protein n=1 Tax=Coniosporium apollinis (strain CBS 100218) TaxID=1168221 RepID=R7YVG9_CONA1|nr:uncharacterized protein W97_05048 [Coniosporium apollinis CBS 100218]EON65809.1 hypothetical protein W97_05048 [Coniosporium apollinis CBS 100218]
MAFDILPMTESDLSAFLSIQHAAFTTGLASLLFSGSPTPTHTASLLSKYTTAFHDPNTYFLKAVDTATGEIAAAAKWIIYRHPRSEEDVDRAWRDKRTVEELKEDDPDRDRRNIEAERAFMVYLADARRDTMGTQPHYLLNILITHPTHYRRGAGAALLRWGIERADQDGLPVYLEASEMGKPLYARWGFEEIKETVFDLTKYGGEGVERNTVMVRPAGAQKPAENGVLN